MKRPLRIRAYDVGVWEALIGGDYYYFEAPPGTADSRLWDLAIDAYLQYIQD